MSPQNLMNECRLAGVLVHLDGGNLKLKGTPEAVRIAADRMRPHKAKLIEYLAAHGANDLVREFMEVDGMTLAEAQATAAISVQPRQAAEWLALIAELDMLIGRYCAAYKLTGEAQAHILGARSRQSLASIPAALAWFRTATG